MTDMYMDFRMVHPLHKIDFYYEARLNTQIIFDIQSSHLQENTSCISELPYESKDSMTAALK